VPDHPVDGAVRVEPAHREAYTRITKAQCAFPQILSAFDVVRLWAESERVPVTGSPREVYCADFSNAAPQDEVCDVAQPIECAGASVDVAAPPISGDAADRP
jgi:hypothetical protein